MIYPRSQKYLTEKLMAKIMGPNPIKLLEELLLGVDFPPEAIVCDLGSGQGLTSVYLAQEYSCTVYAADLWSEPAENQIFFDEMGVERSRLIPVKADATALSEVFEKEFFDAVVSTDSYNYFGRDPRYIDEKLLPFVKSGARIFIVVPGMKKDCHDALPEVLLRSWTPEQLDYLHDVAYWQDIISQSSARVVEISEMESNDEVWADWIIQDNEYAAGDSVAINAGGGKYLNFVKIVLQKK